MPEELDTKAATKRDVAEMSEYLMGEIHKVGGTLVGRMDKLDGRMERMERRFNAFDDRMTGDVKEIKDTLKGPGGLVERVAKVEERVGLR